MADIDLPDDFVVSDYWPVDHDYARKFIAAFGVLDGILSADDEGTEDV